MTKPFNSSIVIQEHISESTFRAYHVGFDQNRFRLKPLIDVIRNVIPEFALGYQGGKVDSAEVLDKLKEAAATVYDTDKYKKRGEFGELILHLLLRDYCGSLPLVSKIYFKDSMNSTVHGFDGVHVVIKKNYKKLWLGESKLYADGARGVRDLIKDLRQHIQADYLRKEFTLIARKLPKSFPEIEHWRNLMNPKQKLDTIYDGICIPLVCTYSSELFKSHKADTKEYFDDFKEECRKLKHLLDKEDIKTSVDVMLMLLPVPDKDALNAGLHQRLKHMQKI